MYDCARPHCDELSKENACIFGRVHVRTHTFHRGIVGGEQVNRHHGVNADSFKPIKPIKPIRPVPVPEYIVQQGLPNDLLDTGFG